MQLQVETQIYRKDAIKDGINDAGTKANHYITLLGDEFGIRVHGKYDPNDQDAQPYSSFVQINSDDISMWRQNQKMMSLTDSTLIFYDGTGTANSDKLAEFGSTIKIYNPTTGTAAVTINSSGATFDGKIQATSGFIGQNTTNGFTIANSAIYNPSTKTTLNSDTIDGIYIGKDGIALGKGSFKVTSAGALTAKSGTIGGFYISGTELDAYGTASGAGTSSTGLYRVLMNANPGTNGGNVALGVATRSSTSASWDWKAYINYNGTLVAKSANISGTITAGTNSVIGPWTVIDSAIYNSKTGVTTTTAGVYLGTDGLNISGGTAATTAYITKSAVNIGDKLIWNGTTLSVTGAITATTLTISGKDYASDITTISTKATSQEVKTAKEAAEKTATNYIGISGSGIKVAASSPTSASNYVEINSGAVNIVADSTHKTIVNSSGMSVYAGDANNSVAQFGTSARIGAILANTYRTEISSNGFKILQRNSGNTADTSISSFNSTGISFNENIPLTIGTTNSYIKWVKENDVWKIKIQADEITMGGHSVDTGGTWYTGTAITGTSTTATIFSSSGITYASIGDMYLNTSTNNTYRCTVAGNASTAKWVYVSNLKGNTGSSYYVHIRYSANSDGTDFTASPQTNTQYIGIYSGTSSSAPTVKTSYTWSKYKGDDTSSQYMTFTDANGLRIYSGDKNSSTYNTVYTQIKTEGITILKDNAHKTVIDGDGMTVYAGDSTNSIAQFGASARIGKETGSHVVTSDTQFAMLSNVDEPYFSIAHNGTTRIQRYWQTSKKLSTGVSGFVGTFPLKNTSTSATVTIYYEYNNDGDYYPISLGTLTNAEVRTANSSKSYTVTDADGDSIGNVVVTCTQVTGSPYVTVSAKNNSSAETRISMEYSRTAYIPTMRFTGDNQILWQGELEMNEMDEITLIEPVSQQVTGICLVWAKTGFQAPVIQYVPKTLVYLNPAGDERGCCVNQMMIQSNFSNVGTKTVYVSDRTITGHDANAVSSGSGSSISPNHSNLWNLFYVFGM